MPDDSEVLEALANEAEVSIGVAAPEELAEARPIRYQPRRLRGETPILGVGADVGDYWSWAHSDVMENVQRGTFAEFLVALALGAAEAIRVGWTGYDVLYRSKKIEVKSSAYLQSWPLRKYSKILFGFQRRQQWDPLTGKMSAPVRVADLYVFAHYVEKSAETANVLDVSKWEFYCALTQAIVERFGEAAKSLTLAQVKESTTGPVPYSDLRKAVDGELDALEGVPPLAEPTSSERTCIERQLQKRAVENLLEAGKHIGPRSRMLQLIAEKGVVEALRGMKAESTTGYTDLYTSGLLGLSVEATIVESKEFRRLFRPDEIEQMERELREYAYDPKPPADAADYT